MVRALESITHTRASNDVYERRLEQIIALPTTSTIIAEAFENPGNLQRIVVNALSAHQDSVLELIRTSSTQDTPFGKHLAQFAPEVATVDRAAAINLIRTGIPIMAFVEIGSGTGKQFHAIHLGLDENGRKLVSLTDPDLHLNPNSDMIRGVLFQPRK